MGTSVSHSPTESSRRYAHVVSASCWGGGSEREPFGVHGRVSAGRADPVSLAMSPARIECAQRQQRDAEVADSGENAVQLGLVGDRAGESGGAVADGG